MKLEIKVGKGHALEWASDPKLPIGSNFCKCSGCKEYFTTPRSFDSHRKGGRCIPPADAGLKLNAKGYWHRTGSLSK